MCSFRRYFRRDFRNRLFKVLVSLKFAAGPITYLQENVAARSCFNVLHILTLASGGVVEPFEIRETSDSTRHSFHLTENRKRERRERTKKEERPVSVFSLALGTGEKFRSRGPCKSSFASMINVPVFRASRFANYRRRSRSIGDSSVL